MIICIKLDEVQTISNVLIANTRNGNSTSQNWETLSIAKTQENNIVWIISTTRFASPAARKNRNTSRYRNSNRIFHYYLVGKKMAHQGSQPVVLTMGHSTLSLEEFINLLKIHSITNLIDVRSVPRSRHNPQFNGDILPDVLERAEIRYTHATGLGGFRRASPESRNIGWRNASFRGFADHMQTAEFAENLTNLLELAAHKRVALMCAEAAPWRCHRSLIADALLVHGIHVEEIISKTRLQAHALTSFAKVDGMTITYPAYEMSS